MFRGIRSITRLSMSVWVNEWILSLWWPVSSWLIEQTCWIPLQSRLRASDPCPAPFLRSDVYSTGLYIYTRRSHLRIAAVTAGSLSERNTTRERNVHPSVSIAPLPLSHLSHATHLLVPYTQQEPDCLLTIVSPALDSLTWLYLHTNN